MEQIIEKVQPGEAYYSNGMNTFKQKNDNNPPNHTIKRTVSGILPTKKETKCNGNILKIQSSTNTVGEAILSF